MRCSRWVSLLLVSLSLSAPVTGADSQQNNATLPQPSFGVPPGPVREVPGVMNVTLPPPLGANMNITSVLDLPQAPKVNMSMYALNTVMGGAGLHSMASPGPPCTFLVPNNRAYRLYANRMNMPEGVQELFSPECNAVANKVMRNHVIPNMTVFSSDLPLNKPVNLATLLGAPLTFTRYENGSVIVMDMQQRGGMLVAVDIPYGLAVMHVINRIMLPPA